MVRKEGPAWQVFEREDLPPPTVEAMRRTCLDLVGLRERAADEAACEDYVIVQVLAAALATLLFSVVEEGSFLPGGDAPEEATVEMAFQSQAGIERSMSAIRWQLTKKKARELLPFGPE